MLGRLRALVRPQATARGGRSVPLADYDAEVKAALKGLPHRTQAAFAAACAERLYPAFAEFVKGSRRDDHGLVRRTLDLAWEGARSGAVPLTNAAAMFEQCVALIPSDQSDEDPLPAHAEDAIASAAYALQAAANLDENAAGWAAQRVTDCLDNFLLSNDIGISQPNAEQLVSEHPLMTAEITRRKEDLRRLADPSDWLAAVDDVRAAAAARSALPLDRLRHEA
jgi:hypothetical protein